MTAVSPHGSGPGGRLAVAAAVAVLMLGLALVLGGCGGSAGKGTSASQLDDEAAGATGGSGEEVALVEEEFAAAGGGDVMAGYTWDQCMADMVVRYGSEETAGEVCGTVQAQYGGSPGSELKTVLPVVESSLGVTPVNPAVPGGSTGTGGTQTGSTGGSTGGSGGSSDGGWGGIEIIVPPAP